MKKNSTSRRSSGNISTCRVGRVYIFFFYKRFYQCVSGCSVIAIGYFLFFATEVGSMKYKMEGKNRVHKNEENLEKVEDD